MTKRDHDCFDFNESASVHDCDSTEATPITTPGGSAGSVYAKIPVAVAERTVSTSLSAKIKFPCPVLEIKDVKKRLKIVQCSLMLPPVYNGNNRFDPVDGQLFLKGFLRKNIQYASPVLDSHYDKNSCISSTIKSHTLDIPWECVVRIPAEEFLTPPERPVLNVRGEYDYHITRELGHGHPEKDHLISSDLSQFHQSSTQHYNEFPFCELISSTINEWDEAIDRRPLSDDCSGTNEGYFFTIIEKVFLQFTIKVLQKQQANVNVVGGVTDRCPPKKRGDY